MIIKILVQFSIQVISGKWYSETYVILNVKCNLQKGCIWYNLSADSGYDMTIFCCFFILIFLMKQSQLKCKNLFLGLNIPIHKNST